MDVAVVVNLHARRGSEAVVEKCRAELPHARVLASRSLEEATAFARELSASPPSLIVSGGGDGTAIALLNAMREARSAPSPVISEAAFGVLPLGTGNAWARVTGAPSWARAVEQLGVLTSGDRPVPTRRYDLVEAFGVVAPFAGTGWDAELIDDFHAQKEGVGLIPPSRRKGLTGYLHALTTRMIPRNLARQRPIEVEILNTGEDALGIDDDGKPYRLPGGENGKVIYRGPTSVCGAGTTTEWGFKFKAFPFARLVPGRFNLRLYAGRAARATINIPNLWRGVHPLPHMHTWLLTSCRATFNEAVPFQVGGDRMGHKEVIDYQVAQEQVDLLDWRAVRASN